MEGGPFLTELDSRAAVKGSRDPLAIQPIWTRLGRHVVGNLTTVSNTVTDFTTVLLGYYFAERLADEQSPGSELETFLKWEQLAGYARGAVNGDWEFRGTERSRERLGKYGKAVLSASRDHQTMSNQKIYGLWGLYSVPARASGLLEESGPRLSPAGRQQVENVYLPILEEGAGRGARRIVQLLALDSCTVDLKRTDDGVLPAVAKVHRRKLTTRETAFYRTHLLEGGPTDHTGGLQKYLVSLLEPLAGTQDFSWSPRVVRDLAKSAARRGVDGQELSYRLERIAACESVMAPVAAAFSYLLSLDGVKESLAAQRFQKQWGGGLRTVDSEVFRKLLPELAPEDPESGERWIGIGEALASGDYAHFVELVLAQNRSVMAIRGGAPWLEERDKTFHVRFREEQAELPSAREVGILWRHPYFLESLREVARLLRTH